MVRKGIQLTNTFCSTIRDWLKFKGGNYLEIGSYYGVFISELAEEFPNNLFYSIEPFITDAYAVEDKETLRNEVMDYYLFNTINFPNIHHFNLTTENCLKEKIYNKINDVSCILLDGSHYYKDICIDIDFVNVIVNNNNREIMVVFDDLHVEDVINAIEYFENIFSNKIFQQHYRENFIYYIIK